MIVFTVVGKEPRSLNNRAFINPLILCCFAKWHKLYTLSFFFFYTFSDPNLVKFHTQYFWSFNWYLVSAWMTPYCFLHFAKSHNNPGPLKWKKVPRFISSWPAIVLFKPLWPSWFIIHLIKWIHFYRGAKSLCLENQWPFLS